ncbi:hypothetical protein JKL07_10320 [Lactiplantibacillus argentoratensis]|nr:hypothetical protein [Lactiplantibacillus argentoratensis]MBT1147068.1 hypothetical protein [Lactiplantibacillus argentoratensis]
MDKRIIQATIHYQHIRQANQTGSFGLNQRVTKRPQFTSGPMLYAT